MQIDGALRPRLIASVPKRDFVPSKLTEKRALAVGFKLRENHWERTLRCDLLSNLEKGFGEFLMLRLECQNPEREFEYCLTVTAASLSTSALTGDDLFIRRFL